jgi:putative ABC transport system permease protein
VKLKDSFKLSLNSITHRKLRAWLTLLGIIIGVAAVVSIISIGNGAQASINESLSGFGADVITISPGFSRAGSFGGRSFEPPTSGGEGRVVISSTQRTSTSSTTTTPTLKNSDVLVIKNNSDVVAVNQIVSGRNSVTYGDKKTTVSIQGVNPLTWTSTINVTLSSGRLLGNSDTRNVVIGNSLATTTFSKPITLGRQIDINGTSFTVVGILASSGSSFGGSTDSTIYMPYTSAWDVVDVNKNEFSSIQVKVANVENIDADINAITADLMLSRRVTSKTQNFSVTSSQTIKEQITSVMQTLTLFLGAIAAVSLLVGAIGIANSMFTSVLEKTRDIGIMKALGASNNEVLILFIIESGLFGLIGGAIGVFVAFLLTSVLNLMGINIGLVMGGGMGRSASGGMSITPELVILAIVLSTIIGIISGVVPASSASKMRPVDALKYE